MVYGFGLVYFRAEASQIGLIRCAEQDDEKSWNNNARNFAEDDKGNLWVSTNGFFYFDLDKGTMTMNKANVNDTSTFSYPSVRGIAYDGKYVILGPTDRGMWLYDVKRKTYRRPGFLPGKEGEMARKKMENNFL